MSRLFPVAVPAFQIRPAGSRSDPSPGVLRDLSHINPAPARHSVSVNLTGEIQPCVNSF